MQKLILTIHADSQNGGGLSFFPDTVEFVSVYGQKIGLLLNSQLLNSKNEAKQPIGIWFGSSEQCSIRAANPRLPAFQTSIFSTASGFRLGLSSNSLPTSVLGQAPKAAPGQHPSPAPHNWVAAGHTQLLATGDSILIWSAQGQGGSVIFKFTIEMFEAEDPAPATSAGAAVQSEPTATPTTAPSDAAGSTDESDATTTNENAPATVKGNDTGTGGDEGAE